MLIHSKLATRKFPDFQEVVRIVQAVEEGKDPVKVDKLEENAACNML